MIGLDSSALAGYLAGDFDRASVATAEVLAAGEAYLPPVVLTEVLSNPKITEGNAARVLSLPLLPILPGYWVRAATLRGDLLRDRLKAEVADCLIAQSCIDHDIPLITYDLDFRHFVRAGLKLL